MKRLIKKESDILANVIGAAVKLGEDKLGHFDGCPTIKAIIRAHWGRSKATMLFGGAGHERLKLILRFGFKVVGLSLSIALIVLLIAAWLVSDPILRLLDLWTHKPKRKAHIQSPKERLLTSRIRYRTLMAIISASTTIWLRTAEARLPAAPTDSTAEMIHIVGSSNMHIWQNGIGSRFKDGSQPISMNLGAGNGLLIHGSRQSNDLSLAGISYCYMLGAAEGEGHWYRGNWEVRGESISGGQFSQISDWLVGITPHLRYKFKRGASWIAYLDLGSSVSDTSIGPPDLSHYLELNVQVAAGVHWFIRDNVAWGIEARYLLRRHKHSQPAIKQC